VTVRRVVITGAGALSPVADSPAGLHAALCARTSGLKSIELFSLDSAGNVGDLGPRQGGEIRPFEPKEYLGDRNIRPVDRTARLLLVAAQQALESAGWTPERRAEREVGLVLGTTFCSVRTIAEFDRRALQLGPSYASPLDFANSVINAAAGQAAIWHGLRGVNSTVAAGEASGLLSLAYAADLIRSGRADAVLAGGAEELCFESFVGFHQAGRLGSACTVPFDARRDGFALAEGAAALLLEDGDAAEARGARILAEVRGHGEAFNPATGEDAEAAAVAITRAVRLALEDAAVDPADLDVLSLAANGGIRSDRAEARGLAAALGGAGSTGASRPAAAVKAMLGEAMGASGAFQAVALLGTFGDGAVPGVLGLEKTDDGFPLSGVAAHTRTLDRRPRLGLLHAAAWDGQCCAVVLEAR
jgi:3-oxoacyl-[acyl-carrier-protein] synthase II